MNNSLNGLNSTCEIAEKYQWALKINQNNFKGQNEANKRKLDRTSEICRIILSVPTYVYQKFQRKREKDQQNI